MKLPKLFIPEKNLEGEVKRLLEKEMNPPNVQRKYSKFEMTHTKTYAKGVAKLKEQGQIPFTFAENIEARITDYELNGEDSKLFKTWLDSVTGIAYKSHSTRFKLILRSDKLENIPQDFNQNFIPVDYDTELGTELDSAKGEYNRDLTGEEAKNHEFWLTAMDGDEEKLAKYVDIWFDKTRTDRGMGIYLRSNISQVSQYELRMLVLGCDYSYAFGYHDLVNRACFVLGAK